MPQRRIQTQNEQRSSFSEKWADSSRK
jgi:hypothetical protein